MRTIRETLYQAECAGCRSSRRRVAVAAGDNAEHRAVSALEAEGWDSRDWGAGAILLCPPCLQGDRDSGVCSQDGHDWQRYSDDGRTSRLACARCAIPSHHRPVVDPDAGRLPPLPITAGWDMPIFAAAGGGLDHLTVIEHRLRDVENGKILETTGGAR